MAMTTEEGKAKRREGLKRANDGMTAVEKIQRAYTNGRPPASEFRTPLAAATAARVLYRQLETEMVSGKLVRAHRDLGVSVAFVTTDLSVLGYTNLFDPKKEAESMAEIVARLDGSISLGLIFGMVDKEAKDKRIVMGSRPFLVTKQTDGWLQELLWPVMTELDMPN